ncbi:MAG: L,D-transpeptidase family protein [Patescibacteria group bacterium]
MWSHTRIFLIFAVAVFLGTGFTCIKSVSAESLVLTGSEKTNDSDADGLSDYWEVVIFKTNPNKKDTDSDGFLDKLEIETGNNPLGKGVLFNSDFDKDGLNDRLEFLFGTNPENADSDGDGYMDEKEVALGFSPTSTRQVPLQKRIKIILSKQRIEQQLGGIVLASYLVSTGRRGMQTPTGEFKILNKLPRAWSKMAGLWMPYWMQFTKSGHGIHELPEWPGGKKEGADHLGIPVSHGCVRLGDCEAKILYDWVDIGTPVTIVG